MNFDTKLGLRGDTPFKKYEQIVEIGKICDNLFFSDYYENGGELKSREEIQNYIKSQVRESIGEFYGEKNNIFDFKGKERRARAESQIDKKNIAFAYQTIGKNSIEEYLNKKQKEYFESKGIDAETYQLYERAVWILFGDYSPEDTLARKDELLKNDKFVEILDKLGYTEAFEAGDVEKVREFQTKILTIGRYSDNPKVDNDMQKLGSYVAKYRADIEKLRVKKLEEMGITPEMENIINNHCNTYDPMSPEYDQIFWEYGKHYYKQHPEELALITDENERTKMIEKKGVECRNIVIFKENWKQSQGKETDPIQRFNKIKGKPISANEDLEIEIDVNEDLYNEFSGVVASHGIYNNLITLGVSVSDKTIIHEFLHAATQSGFKRDHLNSLSKDDAPYSSHMSQNQMFDEVVIEYLALEIFNRRSEKQTIVNKKDSGSSYRVLFEPMKAFIDKEMGNIKDAQMAHEGLSQQSDSVFGKMLIAMKNVLNIEEMPSNPADYFSAIIGEENFNKIALMCNEIMSLSYPENINEITMLDGTVTNDRGLIEGVSKIYADTMSDELRELTEDVSNRNRTKLYDFIDDVRSLPSTLRNAFNTGEKNMGEIDRRMNNTHQQDDGMSM